MLAGIVIFFLAIPLDDGEGYIGMAIGALGILVFLGGLSLLISSLVYKYFLAGKPDNYRNLKILLGAFIVLMIIRFLLRNFTDVALF